MTVFAIIAASPNVPALERVIAQRFAGGRHYVIAPGQYLVDAPGVTSRQLSESLGIADGSLAQLILVLPVTGYDGWHNRDLWEWLSSHLGSSRSIA
jgi:hypothetical protein